LKKMNMEPQNKIQIFQTHEELAEASVKFIIETAKQAIETNGRFVISLSGGHTPERLYTLLSKPPFRDQVQWNKTFVFWGDERCVPPDDKQNNANMARTLLLDLIDIPPLNINAVPVELPPRKAANEYENTLKRFFGKEAPRFDIILLGLGENGHTASLFPDAGIIFESHNWIMEVYVPEQKMFRITMTPDLINQAHNIIFLVEGENKAAILKTVLTADYQPDKFPAQRIKPLNGNLYWFIDSKAAAHLSEK